MLAGDGWVFVENPKTGTRSWFAALRKHCGAEVIDSTHATLMTRYNFNKPPLCAVVVRNPWDRMVSGWAHHAKDTSINFEAWLTGEPWEAGVGLDIKRVPQTCWAWQCNHIMMFEYLEAEWEDFLRTIGMPNIKLPNRNQSVRPKDYREVYNDRTRQLVADRFAPDIQRWGYTF